jgi:hypothetical protein
MNDVHDRYLRKQSSEHPFTFKELQGIMRTYEGSGYLDRMKGHAYTAAKTASTTHAPNRRPPRFNQQVVSFGAGAGGAMQLHAASWSCSSGDGHGTTHARL